MKQILAPLLFRSTCQTPSRFDRLLLICLLVAPFDATSNPGWDCKAETKLSHYYSAEISVTWCVTSGLNHMCWRGHVYAAKTFSRLLDCSLNWPQQIKKRPQLVGYKRAVLLPQLLHCPHWPLLVITRAQNNSSFLQTGVLPDHQGTISQDI